MKKHTWADPTKEWEGFRFTAYGLNWEKLDAMPLTLESGQLPPDDRRVVIREPKAGQFAVAHESPTEERGQDETTKERPLTVAGIYSRLVRCKFEVEERPVILRLNVKTENGEIVLKGPSFNCAMLRELLALKAEGIEPFSSLWFWYDRDSSREDPHDIYNFFVVSGDKIVREDVVLGDYHESGFDPTIFQSDNAVDSIWFNDADWREARTRFWYRKFYTETRTGQLIALRPDEPILYHYQRPQTRNIARELQFVTLLKTYRLLWVALPLLVALAFPRLKEYMAIAAAALGASFLWLCWETRKVGKP
jgi:hypothetical protein